MQEARRCGRKVVGRCAQRDSKLKDLCGAYVAPKANSKKMAKKELLRWTGKSIRKLSLHRRRANLLRLGYGLEHLPFLVFYAFSLYHCFLTLGEPYAAALEELREAGMTLPGDSAGPGNDALSGLAASALSQGTVREDITDFNTTREYDEVSTIVNTMENGDFINSKFLILFVFYGIVRWTSITKSIFACDRTSFMLTRYRFLSHFHALTPSLVCVSTCFHQVHPYPEFGKCFVCFGCSPLV